MKASICGIGLFLLPLAAEANLVINGDFEEPVATTDQGQWVGQPYQPGTNMGGWTVGGIGGVDLVRSFTPASGAQCVNLNGTDSGWIQQLLTGVQSGQTYLLRFALSWNPQGSELWEEVRVSWGGGWTRTITYPRGGPEPVWSYHSYEVVGPFAAVPTLRFESLVPSFWGPMIDDVSVTLVPEPASAAVGLCVLGLLVRPRHLKRFT